MPMKCQSPLVTHDIELADKAFTRPVTCHMPLTKHYYYGVKKLKFRNACVWCSSASSLSPSSDTGTSSGKTFKLRPQCADCIADGRPRIPHSNEIVFRAAVQSRATGAPACTAPARAGADEEAPPAQAAKRARDEGEEALFTRRQRQCRGGAAESKEKSSSSGSSEESEESEESEPSDDSEEDIEEGKTIEVPTS